MDEVKNAIRGNQSESKGGQRRQIGVAISLLMGMCVPLLFLSGCNRDPNVRKHKYLESGERYSAEGKYREAAIQFSNALKIDKNFGEAHYDLALTYIHLGAYSTAFSELLRTVDLQPGKMTPAGVIAQCKALASIGVQHAIFNIPNVHDITPLEIFGREIIPAVAGF